MLRNASLVKHKDAIEPNNNTSGCETRMLESWPSSRWRSSLHHPSTSTISRTSPCPTSQCQTLQGKFSWATRTFIEMGGTTIICWTTKNGRKLCLVRRCCVCLILTTELLLKVCMWRSFHMLRIGQGLIRFKCVATYRVQAVVSFKANAAQPTIFYPRYHPVMTFSNITNSCA